MPKLPLAITAVASMLITLAAGAAAQTSPPNVPAAIICYNQNLKVWRVGYLNTIKENGEATYISLVDRLPVTVNAKGVLLAPDDRSPRLDCYGKTLDELRADGRVLEFQRTP
ncbi:MAG TPA: hypothetical protein VMT22_04585 [Terriglobales bacterium]|nr:hypothetical protein [Terriglobales bacterium]